MGQEIGRTRFQPADFALFERRLAAETAQLGALLAEGGLADTPPTIGLELEAWLVDHAGIPAPRNVEVLAELGDPCVVPELSRFNVEFNVLPAPLAPGGLAAMEAELARRWNRAQDLCHGLGIALVATGILPTLRNADLCLANISEGNRYLAMNEGILERRHGRPLRVVIQGAERLEVVHHDVMMEAATTSFQIHLKLAPGAALRHYNASLLASAPLLAGSANSPFLFGRELWAETRIPLFEQACDFTAETRGAEPLHRIGFGSGYLRESVLEFFEENRDAFPVLLPVAQDQPPERLAHLRLHNGTIWRWNRLLVGFEDDGRAHLRIEQRVPPAGPSLPDQMANLAFYVGLTHALAILPEPPERALAFEAARVNFYAAAREGLAAELLWLDGRRHDARALLLGTLLPLARTGLERYGLGAAEIDAALRVFEQRVASRQTGSAWQRGWVARHGRDALALLNAYRSRQSSGAPVCDWDYD